MRTLSAVCVVLTIIFAPLLSARAAFAAPVAVSFSTAVAVNAATAVQLQGSDADGTALTYAIVGSPSHGAISQLNTSTGALIYTPTTAYTGSDSFTYKVTSGGDDSNTATVSITVTAAKTRIIDTLTNPDGSPRRGVVTFILTKASSSPSGIMPAGASVSAQLTSSGQFDVSIYPSRAVSPVQFYQLYFYDAGGSSQLLGVYDIPASTITIPLPPPVTNANLAAQYTFASSAEMQGIALSVSAATLSALNSAQVVSALGYAPENPAHKDQANGYAGLGGSSKIAGSQIPYGSIANTAAQGNDPRFIDARPPTGTAGGDLSGTYPNPSVAKIQGRAVATTAPTNGQGLVWSDANNRWQPTTTGGGGAAFNQTIQAAGVDQAQRGKLNIVGATVLDDPDNDRTTVSISGGGGGSATLTNFFDVTQAPFNAACDKAYGSTTGTNDRAAIQAAINAAEAAGGGTVWIPRQCLVGTTTPDTYVLTIHKGIRLMGAGGATAGLYFTTDTPATTKLIGYQPSVFPNNEMLTISSLTLGTAGNAKNAGNGNWGCVTCAGGDLLVFDSTLVPFDSYLRGMLVEHTEILPSQMDGSTVAFRVVGENANGVPAKTAFRDDRLYNGMYVPGGGDAVVLDHVTGIGKGTFYWAGVQGAGSFTISNGSIFSNEGGVTIDGATPLQNPGFTVENSYFEPVPGNGCGTSSHKAQLCIKGNTTGGVIRNNQFSGALANQNGIWITENANVIRVRDNQFLLQSGAYMLDLTGLSPSSSVVTERNYPLPGVNLATPFPNDSLEIVHEGWLTKPSNTGFARRGYLSMRGEGGRFLGDAGTPVSVTADAPDCAQYSQFRLEAVDVFMGALTTFGSCYSDSTLQNATELSAGAGDLAFSGFPSGSRQPWWLMKAQDHGHIEAVSVGSHLNQSTANSDRLGVISLSAATSASHSFVVSYTAAPACHISPQFDVGSGVRAWVTATTSAVTVHTSSAVTGDFTYSCGGNPR